MSSSLSLSIYRCVCGVHFGVAKMSLRKINDRVPKIIVLVYRSQHLDLGVSGSHRHYVQYEEPLPLAFCFK